VQHPSIAGPGAGAGGENYTTMEGNPSRMEKYSGGREESRWKE